MARRRLLPLAALWLLAVPALYGQQPSESTELERARSFVEQQQPEQALAILEPMARKKKASAEVHLLLAYCRFLEGDVEAGRTALARSLELDPSYVEAWQTAGALALEDENYQEAAAAFRTLQRLDPLEATTYDLNIGAALLLDGDLATASRHFNDYLRAHRADWTAYFLVAKNYALAERWDLAVQHLEAAVKLDERARREARRDPNFAPMSDYEPYARLLATDTFRPAPGDHYRSEVFAAPFDGGHGILLTAVLNAVQLSGRRYDPAVEVTEDWALVWTDVRIKVTNTPDGGGRIELFAAAADFSPQAWRDRTDALLEGIREQLALLDLHSD